MFYALPNMRADTAFEIKKPWEDWQKFPIPKTITNKTEFEQWRTNKDTTHAFISGVRSEDKLARVSNKGGKDESNPPVYAGAFIADYDGFITDAAVEDMLAGHDKSVPRPSYSVKSFSTDEEGRYKRRLVWLFEDTIRFLNNKHAASFYRVLHEKLNLGLWLPGFDKASLRPNMYFEIGRDWAIVKGSKPIPSAFLFSWLAQASKNLYEYSETEEGPAVNLEKIAELVASEFPGRWEGDFTFGSQGPRFWDATADNPRAAVVGNHGMICFTGPKSFVSWREIFGDAVIDDLIGTTWNWALDNIWRDDQGKFHRWSEQFNRFLPCDKETIREFLIHQGVSATRRKDGSSDLGKLLSLIDSYNRVEKVMPFVHQRPGIIFFMGKRLLNCATAKALRPAPDLDNETEFEWEPYGSKYFPWLMEFLNGFFARSDINPSWVPDTVDRDKIQLLLNLAWAKRVYMGALDLNPVMRQAMIYAGERSDGKTFWVSGVLSPLLGGCMDGKAFLVDGNSFNDSMAEYPILFVDDGTPADSVAGFRRYSAMFKRLTATPALPFNKKFGAMGDVEWFGSLIVALNMDPESMKIIPGLDQSNDEKVMIFKTKKGALLPGYDAQREIVSRELRFFARFLIGWTPPDWVWASGNQRGRYGLNAFHYAEIKEASATTGTANTILMVLRDLYDTWCKNDQEVRDALSKHMEVVNEDSKEYVMRGRVTTVKKELGIFQPSSIGNMSVNALESCLSTLSSKGFPLKKGANGVWEIYFDRRLNKALL